MRVAICDDDNFCRAQVLDIATDYAEERKDKDVVQTRITQRISPMRALPNQ